MTMQVGGKEVLMSGSALLDGGEDLFVEDGKGTTLRPSWDRDEEGSATGGTYHNLTGSLSRQPEPFDTIGGFGVGIEGELKMKMVRYHVQSVHTGKLVSYTVYLEDR